MRRTATDIPLVFASNDALEIKKVLRVLGLRTNLSRMQKPSDSLNFETVVDGILVKGVMSYLQNHDVPAFHIGFTESDIDEEVVKYISEKSGVPFLDKDKKSDDGEVRRIFNNAIYDWTKQSYNVPSTKKLRRKRKTKRVASEVLRDLEIRIARLEAVDLEYIKRLAMAMRGNPKVSGAEMKKTPSGIMSVFVYLANGETIRYEKHFGGVLVIASDTFLDIGNVNHDMMKERMLYDIKRLSR